MICRPQNAPKPSQDIDAMICWMTNEPLRPRQKLAIKHTTRKGRALVKDIQYRLDVNTLHRDKETKELGAQRDRPRAAAHDRPAAVRPLLQEPVHRLVHPHRRGHRGHGRRRNDQFGNLMRLLAGSSKVPSTGKPGASTDKKPVPLAQAVIWVGVGYVVALTSQVVINGLAGRLLGPAHFATYASTVTVIIIMAQLGLFGLQTAALRDASIMRSGIIPDLALAHLSAIKSVTRILLPTLGLTTAVVLAAWHHAHGVDAILFVSGTVLLISVGAQQRLHANYLRGFGSVRISSLLEGRSGGAILLLLQATALVIVRLATPDPTVGLLIFASSLVVPPTVLVSRHMVLRHFRVVSHKWRPLKDLRSTLGQSRGQALLQAGTLLDVQIDVVIAAVVLSSHDASLFRLHNASP